jgi:hypothetical protein
MDEVDVSLPAVDLLAAVIGIPNHDASKRRLALVLVDQGACLGRREIARAGGALGTGQTDEDLRILALSGCEEGHPVVEVDAGALADRVVIELNVQLVELALRNDGLHLEPLIRQGAFGCRRDQILLARVLAGQITEPLDHGDIAGLVIYKANNISITSSYIGEGAGRLTELVFDIEVKAVKHEVFWAITLIEVVEGSWLLLPADVLPRGRVGTKSAPYELGEAAPFDGVRDGVVRLWRVEFAADGEEDLLPLALAVPDIGRDQTALAEELGVDLGVVVLVRGGDAVTGEVSSGVPHTRRIFLGRAVDEAERDNLKAGAVTVVPESLSAWARSPVDIDGWGGKGRGGGEGRDGQSFGEHYEYRVSVSEYIRKE